MSSILLTEEIYTQKCGTTITKPYNKDREVSGEETIIRGYNNGDLCHAASYYLIKLLTDNLEDK